MKDLKVSRFENLDVMDYKSDESYLIEYQSQGRDYAQMKRLRLYYEMLKKLSDTGNQERISKIKDILKNESEKLRKMLQEDVTELEKCFEAGAYKATLILAGSILEAFLIDWLSEKDGVDYFVNPYKVVKTNNKGMTYEKEDDRLVTYINAIKEIEMPNWMEPAEKANNIRNNRNLVHIKLCMKDDIKIDRKICCKVISDLKDIISTRHSGDISL
ncbi:MAG: hypothetical protein IJX85_01445 [Lachnospiraceae bacterium]|nr:hypothetical protein [Lachnospiraceae bacterium]